MPKYAVKVRLFQEPVVTVYAANPKIAAERGVETVKGWNKVVDAKAIEVREAQGAG